MRVMVTGATGFVGQHLMRLLAAGHSELFGTYLNPPGRHDSQEHVKLIACDLRRADEVQHLMEDVRPDHVYHLAALSSVRNSFEDVRAVYESNFLATLNVLEVIRNTNPSARVLLVGSGHCYGKVKRNDMPIRENQPLVPDSPYGVSKAAADMLGSQFFQNYGLHVIRARPFNHTGPGQSPHFVCSDFARQFAAIEFGVQAPIIKVGNINVRRDFSDVRDVVRAYTRLIAKGTAGEAYNVGSGRAVSLRRVLAILQSWCPQKVRIEVDKQRFRKGESTISFGSIRKLKQRTGWHPEFELRTTLRDLYLHWKTMLLTNANVPGGDES